MKIGSTGEKPRIESPPTGGRRPFACATGRFARTLALSVSVFVLAAAPAQAYVDPGSGTFLLQILAATAIGGLFYLRRIRDFFIGIFRIGVVKKEAPEKDE